jgi:predicted metalloprotease with PDZ domain
VSVNASGPVRYAISPVRPAAHLFRVTCRVPSPDPKGQRFSLPAWIPGSYLIRDFSRHIVSIRAEAGGRPVRLEKIDKSTWRAAPCAAPLTVLYEVYARDLSVRAAYLDEDRAFFNASSVFLSPAGLENAPCRIEILPPPEGNDRARWRIATALPRLSGEKSAWNYVHEFGEFHAPNYAALLDCPVEIGSFREIVFAAEGVPHLLAITGAAELNEARLARDVSRICAAHIRMFGQPRLTEPYLFLLAATEKGYGGLEHDDASALLAAREDLPKPGLADGETPPEYARLLGLISHEYFHRWNVRRIRPSALLRADLQRENYTRLLWFFEGATSYYDDLALLRAGVISETVYLELLGKTLTRVRAAPGRFLQSLAEASFDAWIKYYRPNENTPNAEVSYYDKGAVVALWLDLSLRRMSKGKTSLDDLMRALWRDHGEKDSAGVGEEEIFARVETLGGKSLRRRLRALVEGTEDPPLRALFASAGVRLAWRAESSAPWLGLGTRAEGGKARITKVLSASPAEKAGLAADDTLAALAGREIGASNLETILARFSPGAELECHYFREGLLRVTKVRLAAPPENIARLLPIAGAEAKIRRARWFCCA